MSSTWLRITCKPIIWLFALMAAFASPIFGQSNTSVSSDSLVSAVLSVKNELALDVLDELVIAANHSELDTSQARTGFETSLFKKLASKNEERTTAAAIQFKDPLRQIVALAGIEQWKSEKLAADEKLRRARK